MFPTTTSVQGVGKVLGEDIARIACSNWSKGIKCNVCSAIKAKRRKWGTFLIVQFVIQDNHYLFWSPSSGDVAGRDLLMGSREFIFCFHLLLHETFVFPNCLSLEKPWGFYVLFSSLLILLRSRVPEWFCGHLVSSQDQPTKIHTFLKSNSCILKHKSLFRTLQLNSIGTLGCLPFNSLSGGIAMYC